MHSLMDKIDKNNFIDIENKVKPNEKSEKNENFSNRITYSF